MNIASYMNNIKKDLLPWVKDWTDPQDHIRNEYNVKKLNFWDWFWCHPTGYLTIYFGTPSLVILQFLAITLFSIYKGWLPLSIFAIVCMGWGVYDMRRKIKGYADVKTTTFYDMWFREYKVQEIGDKNENK